ncbi:AraC family transcriptional regulator [Paenibacillus sp. OV219]|uniref:AraC family transcriptional regulator n=1 Tax=Paenibacillus sp. OV219 TaxID=1884377 RepID=UPI0008CF6C56|nr:AraC family transcriptional regulator [Paenibacillus sp. OV219]SEO31469.1 AraC-type DNA-binding protein [Paenibacillus sp. OV219]
MKLPVVHLCGDFVVRRNWKLELRRLEQHELVYFPIGTGTTYHIAGKVYTLDKPCWVITRAGALHGYQFSETSATRHQFIHFTLEDCFELALLTADGPDVIPIRDGGFQEQMLRHLIEVSYTGKDSSRSGFLLAALLNELSQLGFAAKQKETVAGSSYSPIVGKALAYIRRHLVEPISVVEIASHCELSQEHLSRLFAREVGIPLRQMIIQLRLERAAYHLRHSTLSINEIASQCGYSENHYFSRTFAAYFGISASVYRGKYAAPAERHVVYEQHIDAKYPINTYIYVNP